MKHTRTSFFFVVVILVSLLLFSFKQSKTAVESHFDEKCDEHPCGVCCNDNLARCCNALQRPPKPLKVANNILSLSEEGEEEDIADTQSMLYAALEDEGSDTSFEENEEEQSVENYNDMEDDEEGEEDEDFDASKLPKCYFSCFTHTSDASKEGFWCWCPNPKRLLEHRWYVRRNVDSNTKIAKTSSKYECMQYYMFKKINEKDRERKMNDIVERCENEETKCICKKKPVSAGHKWDLTPEQSIMLNELKEESLKKCLKNSESVEKHFDDKYKKAPQSQKALELSRKNAALVHLRYVHCPFRVDRVVEEKVKELGASESEDWLSYLDFLKNKDVAQHELRQQWFQTLSEVQKREYEEQADLQREKLAFQLESFQLFSQNSKSN